MDLHTQTALKQLSFVCTYRLNEDQGVFRVPHLWALVTIEATGAA